MTDGRLLCIVRRAWSVLPATLQAHKPQQAHTQGLPEQVPCSEYGDYDARGHLVLLLGTTVRF